MRNYKMRYSLFFTFIFSSFLATGQIAIIKKIKQKNPITKAQYIFPKILITNHPNESRKINEKLKSDVLNADSSISDNDIFSQVWKTEEQASSIEYLDYEISRNETLLSLKISGEGCGAYCEPFDYYYSFNLRTGNQLFLDSLLNKSGLERLLYNFNLLKRNKITAKLKAIKDTLKTINSKTDRGNYDYYSEMLNLYKECINNKITFDYINYIEFMVAKNKLKVYADRCSVHYNRNVDELWTFEYSIDLRTWTKYLTEYGKALLNK